MLNTQTTEEGTIMSAAWLVWTDESNASTFNAAKRCNAGSGTYLAQRRARMALAQGGLCTRCGEPLEGPESDNRDEMSHLVPATFHGAPQRDRAGFLPGNLSVWHLSCNRTWGEKVVRFEDLARPDLVFTGTWRDLPFLV